jgi:aminoglycoside phosphotransferase (APT) family kinase protein
MSPEPFPGLRAYLAGRFGPEAREASIEPLGGGGSGVKEGGYGVPYAVRWKTPAGPRALVLETVRPGAFGHEDRSDRAALVLRAYDEYAGLPRHVAAVDVGAFREDGPVGLAGTHELFVLTEFAEGAPYADDFERIAAAGRLEPLDRDRAVALADYLAGIHAPRASHPSWYRRRLRELTGSGECLAGVADSYPSPADGFPDARLLEEVERLALGWRYRLRDRSDRLRTVHGDFHPWNILFRRGSDFTVLDRSRGALGDPADDVAALAINPLFYALRTRGGFEGPFAELFRTFWDRYLERSGDGELPRVIAPHLAFRALVVANPLWYPRESEAVRRALFRFLLSVLEAPAFEPDLIPDYLARSSP